MFFSRSGINLNVFFLSLRDFILDKLKHHRSKTHDFTKYVPGSDYVFEVAENLTAAYITARGKGVKVDDYIVLQIGSEPCLYKIEKVDYYSNPSDVWMALLNKVTNNQQ